MQVEADNCSRGVRLNVDFVGFHRKHREQIAMRMVAFGRARPAVAGRAEIGACLQRTGRHFSAGTSGAGFKFGHVRRNVDDQPVPEARAGRRVGVIAGDGEAFRAHRRSRPLKMRRLVAAGAAEAEIGGQDKIFRKVVAILEAVARDRERHVPSP
jgi:hypothetical protein